MPLYISLMRLKDKALAELEDSPARGRVSAERVARLGGRSLALYATMGQYDFVQVFEMPDEASMMQYLVTARRDGFVDPVVMPAFDGEQWRDIVGAVLASQ